MARTPQTPRKNACGKAPRQLQQRQRSRSRSRERQTGEEATTAAAATSSSSSSSSSSASTNLSTRWPTRTSACQKQASATTGAAAGIALSSSSSSSSVRVVHPPPPASLRVSMYHVEVSDITTGNRMEAVSVRHSFFTSKEAALAYAYTEARGALSCLREEYDQEAEERRRTNAPAGGYSINPETGELDRSSEGNYFFPDDCYEDWGQRITTTLIELDFSKEIVMHIDYSAS